MPILRSITLKLKTKLSPTSSPATSPQDPVPFERLGGRKVTMNDITAYTNSEYVVSDDCISTTTKGTGSSIHRIEKKDRRMSKFREELDDEL